MTRRKTSDELTDHDDGGDDAPGGETAGMMPMEDEATGFSMVADGDEAYDNLRMPHERDESVPPPDRPAGRPRVKRTGGRQGGRR